MKSWRYEPSDSGIGLKMTFVKGVCPRCDALEANGSSYPYCLDCMRSIKVGWLINGTWKLRRLAGQGLPEDVLLRVWENLSEGQYEYHEPTGPRSRPNVR